MTPELLTALEHGGLAIVLWMLLTRVMDRLDKVTDKLIEIAEKQTAQVEAIQAWHEDIKLK